MAAPKGNNFWELRSKHGRDKLFATPELMWEAACEYFQWCEDNPITKVDYVGKDGDMVHRSLGRPFTLSGLCLYLDCSSAFFRSFKSTLNDRDNKDFVTVLSKIEETIFSQQFSGATVGMFKENIISRALGLKDGLNLSTPFV